MSSMLQRYRGLHRNQQGMVLITVLIIGLLLTFIGLSLSDLVIAQYSRTANNVFVSNALMTAEAGAEQTLFEINDNSSFLGFAEETVFYNNEEQGRATYQTTITNGTGANERIITSKGRTYRYDSTEVVSERSVRVTIVATASPGYSVQTGPGGLILGGSTSISSAEIYVNGFLTLNGASRIGTQSDPVNVHVGHYNCPAGNNPGPTFPSLCSSGQPITMAYSTSIYGTVCATNQTSKGPNDNIKTGNGGQGLIPNCTAPKVSMPTYDRSAHIAKMSPSSGYPANNTNYNCSQWRDPDGFARTWPANLRLNGNVNIGSSCDLVITGDVYITGNLEIGGAARIRIDDSLGTTRPVIAVDGEIKVGGSSTLISNSSGTSAHFISYKSSASCSPNCSTVTGTDLKVSQGKTTVDVHGAGNYPGTIFHSYWGTVKLGGSGNMGSAIGQTVDLSGAGTIVFGTSLATGDSRWTVRSYQYDFQ